MKLRGKFNLMLMAVFALALVLYSQLGFLVGCLAFAMKLAAKQAELSACKYVSEDSKAKLSAASPAISGLLRQTSISSELRLAERGSIL